MYKLRIEEKPIIQTVFASFDEKGPVLFLRVFKPHTKPDDTVDIMTGRYDCLGDCAGFYTFLGNFDPIQSFVDNNPSFLDKTEPVTAARILVEKEISLEPEHVGPPVDIIRVTRGGAQWVQKKQECPAVESQARPTPSPHPARPKKRRRPR